MLWRVLASTLQWYMPCRSWNIHIQVNIDKNRGAKIKKQASYFEKRNHFDSAFFTISPTLYEIDKLQMSCKFYQKPRSSDHGYINEFDHSDSYTFGLVPDYAEFIRLSSSSVTKESIIRVTMFYKLRPTHQAGTLII